MSDSRRERPAWVRQVHHQKAEVCAVAKRVVSGGICQTVHRWSLERRPMGAGEGSNNLGQCPEMKMNHAADGMMMVEEIAVDGE